MVQRAWNLPMFFLPEVMHLFGKRNGSLLADIGCRIPCCRRFRRRLARATSKNFVVYFMWLLPARSSTLLFPIVASKMMDGNWNLRCSLQRSWSGNSLLLREFLSMSMHL